MRVKKTDDECLELCKKVIAEAKACEKLLNGRDMKFIPEPYFGHSAEMMEKRKEQKNG